MQKWRLLLPGSCTFASHEGRRGEAAWNMAFDEALLESSVTYSTLPTLRLYFWEHPAVTIGRFQNAARTLDSEAIATQRLPLVRRITGGRGILHGQDLTICMTAPVSALGLPEGASIATIYEKFAAGYVRGFALLGIAAAQGVASSVRERGVDGDCFHQTSPADIADVVSRQKRLGAALHRRGVSVLQQASIPVCTKLEIVSPFRGGKDQTSNAIRESLNPGSVLAAVIDGMAAELGINFVSGLPTENEIQRAERLILTRYGQPEWTLKGSCNIRRDEIDS